MAGRGLSAGEREEVVDALVRDPDHRSGSPTPPTGTLHT
jgi:hypothetical protein